jgi:hypothetical protein
LETMASAGTGLEPYPLQPKLSPPIAFADVALHQVRRFVASVGLDAVARQLLGSRAGRVAGTQRVVATALASLRVLDWTGLFNAQPAPQGRLECARRLRGLAGCSPVVSIAGADEVRVLTWHAITPTRNLTVRGVCRGRGPSEHRQAQQGTHNCSHDHSPFSLNVHLLCR